MNKEKRRGSTVVKHLGIALSLCLMAFSGMATAQNAGPQPPQSSAQNVTNGSTELVDTGSYSFSLSHRGTCSHHGGVDAWLTSEPGWAS